MIEERELSREWPQEHKYIGSLGSRYCGLALLDHWCIPDPDFAQGRVRSIYYDDMAMSAYYEKVNGDFLKQKVRLRWYDPDQCVAEGKRTAFLEVKRKAGSGRSKKREQLDLDSEWLEEGDLTDERFIGLIRGEERPHGGEVPYNLFPVAEIQYKRWRFMCPTSGARVCLDAEIAVERVNSMLIANAIEFRLNDIVVEIKDVVPEEVPWVNSLCQMGFRKDSFSKYGRCMSRLTMEE